MQIFAAQDVLDLEAAATGAVGAVWRTFASAEQPSERSERSKRCYALWGCDRLRRNDLVRQSVASMALQSVGYDERTETLEVQFVNGSVYRYDGVPLHVHEQ